MSDQLGVRDVPCENLDEDSLGIRTYVKSLETFIEKCPTPMSIALQGDWGTGKTSFLRAMKNDFDQEDKKNKITTIYFNTWQYSQFNMAEGLYSSFICNIVDKLKNDFKHDEAISQSGSEIFKKVTKLSANILAQIAQNATKIDIQKIMDEALAKEEERTREIEKLKDEFAKIVKCVAQKAEDHNGRVVIFVDDLDRLNPEVAVELLEVMKLFMDVEHCVYVLAIDYEVVVTGVRKKFGSNMSEEKCRSFFDKIIQLPFKMPVAQYRIDAMLQNILNDQMEKYIGAISYMVKRTLGTNPRAIKRLANSFFLLSTVKSQLSKEIYKDKECQDALLFLGLTIQLYSDNAYKALLECVDVDDLKKLLHESQEEENDQAEDEAASEALDALREAIGLIQNDSNSQADTLYEDFLKMLNLSFITSVGSNDDDVVRERKSALKITEILVYGQKFDVVNPTHALVKCFNEVLIRNPHRVAEFVEKYSKMVTTDVSKTKSAFRKTKKLEVSLEDKPLYLGTSTSSEVKMEWLIKLSEFMELQPHSIIWYNGEEVVFANR